MKIIGKQIVVELPEEYIVNNDESSVNHEENMRRRFYNQALSEVAKMNQAWEVDEENIKIILEVEKSLFHNQTWLEFKTNVAQALASNPSAWMKRKDSDENK